MIYHTKVNAGRPAVLLLALAIPAVMGVIILVAGVRDRADGLDTAHARARHYCGSCSCSAGR